MGCPIPVMNKPQDDSVCVWVWVWDGELWQYKTECGGDTFDLTNAIHSDRCHVCGKPIKILPGQVMNKPQDDSVCVWVYTDWDNIDCGYETECGKRNIIKINLNSALIAASQLKYYMRVTKAPVLKTRARRNR
jgi:hypothetical protein